MLQVPINHFIKKCWYQFWTVPTNGKCHIQNDFNPLQPLTLHKIGILKQNSKCLLMGRFCIGNLLGEVHFSKKVMQPVQYILMMQLSTTSGCIVCSTKQKDLMDMTRCVALWPCREGWGVENGLNQLTLLKSHCYYLHNSNIAVRFNYTKLI